MSTSTGTPEIASENLPYTVELHKVNYVWTIDNFSSHEKVSGKEGYLTSPIFSASTDDNYKWYLLCMPSGKKSGVSNDVSVYLRLSQLSPGKQICTEFSIHVVNEKLKELRSLKYIGHVFDNAYKESSHLSDKDDNDKDWGWTAFLKKDKNFKNKFLIEDKLTISCKLSFFEISERIMNPFFRQYNPDSLQHLSEDLAAMRENTSLTDVVLSVAGKLYPAHKCMLSARSKVFNGMFRNDTKENRENRVEITDMNEEVAEELLKFVYSGSCENVEKLADGLLVAADKYDMADLKRFCEESLYKTVTVENAVSMLVLADTFHANVLKSKIMDLIVEKSFQIVNSGPWTSIMPSYPALINEICVALSRRGSTT